MQSIQHNTGIHLLETSCKIFDYLYNPTTTATEKHYVIKICNKIKRLKNKKTDHTNNDVINKIISIFYITVKTTKMLDGLIMLNLEPLTISICSRMVSVQ